MRTACLVLLMVLPSACSLFQSSVPLESIADERVRALISAAFDAHGAYQDLRDAGALSFIVVASGPMSAACGQQWRAHVELSPYPRSRWMFEHGLFDIDRHAAATILPTDFGDHLPADTRELLHATALLLAMPMPLIQSAGAPAYSGRRQAADDTWDVLALPTQSAGWAGVKTLSVFLNRASRRVDRLHLELISGRCYWLIASGIAHAYRLAVADEVRWFAADASGLPGELLMTLELDELFAQPAERALVPLSGAQPSE